MKPYGNESPSLEFQAGLKRDHAGPGDLLQTQHRGESSVILGIGQIFSELVSLESSDEKETQCGDTGNHSADGELALSEQVGLAASQLIGPEPIR